MTKNKKNNHQEKQNDLDLKAIRQALDNAENQIIFAKNLIFANLQQGKAAKLKIQGRVVEGIFDGELMQGADNKHYPVSVNYASKSKLIPGDELKLTITEDGSFVFKQIGPVARKRVVGILKESNENYFVEVEGKNYQVLGASITFFKAKPGNKVTLIIPKDEESNWGAMENVLP